MSEYEDDSDAEGSMAFMFDTAKKKDVESFHFDEASELDPFSVDLKMIKGDPGHQQSGQYLWPASCFNARYCLSHQSDLGLVGKSLIVVELGAGCGLSALAVSHLPNVKSVILTDYDYGALDLLRDNADACVKTYKTRAKADAEHLISVEKLKWGTALSSELTGKVGDNNHQLLLIGSDLIYCYTVCLPLFTTVKELLSLAPPDSCFVLVSSFELKPEIESAAVSSYTSLGLEVVEKVPLNVSEVQCRVQVFTLGTKGEKCKRNDTLCSM